MTKAYYTAFTALFLLLTLVVAVVALCISSVGVCALAAIPGFVAGWCAGKASWA